MTTQLITEKAKRAVVLPKVEPPNASILRTLAPEDEVLLDRLLHEPADLVDHPDFDQPKIESLLFGAPAKLTSPLATRFVEIQEPIADAIASGERVPTLSQPEEARLFMRYNYARHQIAEIIAAYSGKKLTAPSVRMLLAWGHRALAARSVIVRLNLPLVLAMAKRTKLSNVDFNEMVSEGNMALLRSVEKFDCARGFKFSTYSCRAILKSFSRVAMRASRYRGTFPMEFDPAMERSDYAESQRVGIEQDCVDELKDIILQNLAGLSDVETTVISERFALGKLAGIDAPLPKTLEQVGMIIGVTKERVRQIQNNALRKIRAALEDRYLAA